MNENDDRQLANGARPRTPAAEPDRPLDSDVERRIQSYIPRDIPQQLWLEILRPFVVGALRASRPSGRSQMEQNARVLTWIAHWCWDQGIPLDIEVVLDPDTVERFFSIGMRDFPSRGTYRTVLRRLGPQLTDRAPWAPRPEPMRRRKVALPYSAEEMKLLESDARRQPTDAKRRSALGFIAFGAGAGLDGRWVAKVRGTDVVADVDGVLVEVGEPRPRSVPVLARYEGLVLELAAAAGAGYVLHSSTEHRNRTNKLAAGLKRGPDHPVLSAPRLRSTWIVEHLRRGTRLPELLTAAGPTRVESIDELLAWVEPMDERAARRVVRGRE
jgi:hypothetical protein